MPTPESIGKIIPVYEGFGDFAPSLSWNQSRLDRIARGADLRTTISIREGGARGQSFYENLGEILALKTLVNPADLFRRGLGKNGHAEVSPIFADGRADIYLNHQLVMQEVMEKSKGKFDEKLYAQTLDSLTRQGVNNILASEKLAMAVNSGIVTGVNLAFLGIGVGLVNLFFQGTLTGLLVNPPTEPLSWNYDIVRSYRNYYTTRFLETFIAMPFVHYDVKIIFDMMKDGREARSSNDPYQRGFNDIYNPFKPIKDYLSGYVLLKTTSSLIEYQP